MDVNFGLTAADYGRFRAGFPEALFARLQEQGAIRPGLRMLDLGTGTGSLGRGFARRGCAVVGLDLSPDLIAQARRLDGGTGVRSAYLAGSANQVALASQAFDVVAAGQCWHWFDRAAAARRGHAPRRRRGAAHGLLVRAARRRLRGSDRRVRGARDRAARESGAAYCAARVYAVAAAVSCKWGVIPLIIPG